MSEVRGNNAATADSLRLQLPLVKPPPWHGLVSADLFLSALAAGVFVAAAVGDLIAPSIYASAATIGYFIALPTSIIDLGCLVLDLGDPLRFHHMLRMFKPRSPMSTGVWGLSGLAMFSAAGALLSALMLFGIGEAHLVRQIVGIIGLAPALFAGAYKGVLLSATAQPGWKDARWLGAQLALSSMALGAAALLLCALFAPLPMAIGGFRVLLIVLLTLELLVSVVVTLELRGVAAQSGNIASRLTAYALRFRIDIIASLILAAALPSVSSLAASSIFALLGSLAFRHHLVMIPHRAS